MVDTLPCELLKAMDNTFFSDAVYAHVISYLNTLWVLNVNSHQINQCAEHDPIYDINVKTVRMAQRIVMLHNRNPVRPARPNPFKELVTDLDTKHGFLSASEHRLQKAISNESKLRQWADACFADSLKQIGRVPVKPNIKDPGEAA